MKYSLLSDEELGYEKFDTTKPIRLIELFGGYGSQAFALKYLGANFEHWKLCEWAVKSIQAYKDAHCGDDNTDYSETLKDDDIYDILYKLGISANYNEPMTYEQIKRIGIDKARQIYNNIKATHNLVNIQQVKGEDLEIRDTDKYCYVMTYSFPCQDLSLAGKGMGMSKGSDSRSSMLWQVERILEECKESNCLPQVLVMENVPQVHGTNNMEDFKLWVNKLEQLGYSNYYKDLNAKNFGIPQNRERCFMVSLLGHYKYDFPTKIQLEKRLKDLLENSVDEKYYLSDKVVSKLAFDRNTNLEEKSGVDLCDTKSEFRDISNTIKSRYDCGYEHFSPGPTGVVEPQLDIIAKTKDNNNFNTVYSDNGISPTLLARDYKDPVRVGELKQVAQMYPDSGNPQAGRIYDKDGVSPCLDTCQGGNREVKIVDTTCTELQKEVVNKAVDYLREGDVIDYTYSNSRLEEMNSGFIRTKNSEDNSIMNTLTTTCENFGVCVEEPQDNLKRQLCNKLIEENKVQEGDIIRHSYTNSRFDSFHIENEENHDCCATLTTRPDCIGYVENQEQKPCPTLDTRCDCLGVVVNEEPKIKQNLRIRKLTPKECGRLMAVKDSDIENICKNQSNASSYHLFGDSIVCTCLMAIFGKLLGINWKEHYNPDDWWKNN